MPIARITEDYTVRISDCGECCLITCPQMSFDIFGFMCCSLGNKKRSLGVEQKKYYRTNYCKENTLTQTPEEKEKEEQELTDKCLKILNEYNSFE